MTALYRSGDPAGALAVYAECRRILADYLGLEPSPDLTRLHRAVLDRDPALAPAARVSTTTAPETPAPQELPVRCRSRVPHRLLRHLGVPPSDIPWMLDEAAAVLRSHLAHRAVLLVLDGATEPASLRELVPAAGSCAVLITTRAPLMLDGAEHLALDPLCDVDGQELLARLAGPARVNAEPAAAAEIVRYCHGIPLALRIAGTILAYRPARSLSWLARRLAPEQHRLDELSFGGQSVRALYAGAFQPVAGRDPLVAAAFRLLGRPGYEVCGITTAAAALGVAPMKVEAALDRLVDLGLAEWGEHDTYRLPPLMRLYSAELEVSSAVAR